MGGCEMEWGKIIIEVLSLQDVELLDVKLFKKDGLRAEIKVKQIRFDKSCCSR